MGTKVKKEKHPNGKVKSILTYDGEILNGPAKYYYENGQIEQEENYVDDLLQGEVKQYYESGNILVVSNWIDGVQQGLVTKYYEDGKKNRESTIIDGFFDGDQTEWWNNGKIKAKRFYKKDIIINLTEWDEDGELIKESISETLVAKLGNDFYGDPIPDAIFGSEIYFKEWKEGNLIKEELQYEYSDSNVGTKNKTEDEDFWWNWSREKHKKYSSIKTYYDNGKLKMQSQFYSLPQFFRHASNREEVAKYSVGPLKEYFPSGNIKCEGNYKNNERDGLWIDYFETGKVKREQIFNNDICESVKEWDKDGKLIKEKVLEEGEERTRLQHEIMTKGVWYLTLKGGTEIEVRGQRHELREVSEYYEDGEWIEGDSEIIEDFHLTEYEEGHLYEDEDLHKFFDIDDDSYPEWDFNGSSYNWSGIGNEDNYETSRKKWDDYKSQFPKVTSKDQFRID